MKNRFCLILYLLLVISCQESEKDKFSRLVKEWDGKEIRFPARSVFTVQGRDTVDFDHSRSVYKVVMYADSEGCISCNLQLAKWKRFMQEVNATRQQIVEIPFIYYFYAKNKRELRDIMRLEDFTHPVCLDEQDEFNKLNCFSSETAFQTFLLDQDNRVIVIGNPMHNVKVKELYLKLLRGETSSNKQVLTTAELNLDQVNFGTFPKTEKQMQVVELRNTGTEPLVIQEVNTSCGCTKVEFEKRPIVVGGKAILTIIYEADDSGYFKKTIDVFCNTASSALQIVVTGEVEER